MKRKQTKGEGIFTPFENMYKDFSKLGKSASKTMSAVVNGASDYSPKVRKIISNYGDRRINKITIGRTPVSEVLTKVLSTASSNFKENVNNMPYDKLFHLFVLLQLEGGSVVRLEKNEVINADLIQKLTPDTELREVSSVPNNLSFNMLLSNAQKSMAGNFFKYSARDNNCQDFILGLFNGSNIGDSNDRGFIKQDTKQLFENTGFLRKFANTVTETGARFNALTQGGNIRHLHPNKDNGLTNTQIMKLCKELKIPCKGCFVKDELKKLTDGNYIINLNGQSHWTALIKKGSTYVYFDSYGFKAPEEIEALIPDKYLYNKSEIQGLEQTSCGYYCLAFLKDLQNSSNLHTSFEDYLNLFGKSKKKNQDIIKRILYTH